MPLHEDIDRLMEDESRFASAAKSFAQRSTETMTELCNLLAELFPYAPPELRQKIITVCNRAAERHGGRG